MGPANKRQGKQHYDEKVDKGEKQRFSYHRGKFVLPSCRRIEKTLFVRLAQALFLGYLEAT